MGWRERLKAAFSRESAEVKAAYREAQERLDADLSRREAELTETPEQKLERLRHQATLDSDPFEEVRARIERMKKPPDTPTC